MPCSQKERKRAKAITEAMTLEEKVRMFTGDTYWSTFPLKRFQLDACTMSDGPHGVRKVKEKDHLGQAVNEPATGFPASVSMAATWNKKLLYDAGCVLGRECQSMGVDILLGPAVNMKRSVLGGRNFEYLSEDPVLAGKLGAQLVNGIQSTGTGACVKHFACNNSESHRMTADVRVDERTLHELYLRVFEIIVRESSPIAVMGAYNKINGCYACEHKELLTRILREEWGFSGIVISDWLAVDDCVRAAKAGLNLEMPHNPVVYQKLTQAVKSGELPEAVLNERVTELLTVLLTLQGKRNPGPVLWEQHRMTARSVAVQSMVLIKNDGRLLPIDWEKTESLAVIGDFAAHPRTQGGGSSRVEAGQEVTVLSELHKALGSRIAIRFEKGYDANGDTSEALLAGAKEAAKNSSAVVIFAGLPDSYESEGYDREHMRMPEGHVRLIREISKVRRDVLVVLSNGSPVELPFLPEVDGVLETWLLGQEAAWAIAAVLSNKEQPSGRMPETFPVSLTEEAAGYHFEPDEGSLFYGERMMTGYRYYDKRRLTPAVPFGFGLSYTEFTYSCPFISREQMSEEDEAHVSVKVKNTGAYPGYEVVQLYVSNQQKTMLHPEKELNDFEKIFLMPQEEKTVEFRLDRPAFECYSQEAGRFMVQAGSYQILIGASSRDIRFHLELRIALREPFIRELTDKSTLEEWLAHPKGKPLAEKMLSSYRGFGMREDKGFLQLSHFVQRIMLEMPMQRLAVSSQGSFTEEDLYDMLGKLANQKRGAEEH